MAVNQSVGDRVSSWFETEVTRPLQDFQDPGQEWRRLFSEFMGTFFRSWPQRAGA